MRFLSFIFLLISLNAFSQQQMTLSVKVENHISEQFYLQGGSEMGLVTIDSSRVKAFGTLFIQWKGRPDFYRLSDGKGHFLDFRMTNSSLSFEIKGRFSDAEYIFDSEDKNNQVQYYLSEFDYYKSEAESLAKAYNQAQADDQKEVEKTYKTLQKESENLIKDLWSKRTNDWSLQLALAHADRLPDLDNKIKTGPFIDQFFEYFDFTDSLIVGSPCFYAKLDRFFDSKQMQYLIESNDSKEIELAIQHIFWLSEVNNHAQECLMNYLLNRFPHKTHASIHEQVIKTYKMANSCEYVLASKSMRERMENDKSFTKGSKAPDFVLSNCLNLNLESFSKVNSDLTLLIVWSAHCEESLDLLTRINRLYHTYQEKGLEVVAISIDHNLMAWENFVEEHNYSWVNACDKAGLKSEFAMAYNITSTPNMFLISADQILVSKPLTFYQLKREIEDFLN